MFQIYQHIFVWRRASIFIYYKRLQHNLVTSTQIYLFSNTNIFVLGHKYICQATSIISTGSSCIMIWLHRHKYICLSIQLYFLTTKIYVLGEPVSILIHCKQLYHNLATPTKIYLFGDTGIFFWRQKYMCLATSVNLDILQSAVSQSGYTNTYIFVWRYRYIVLATKI